MSITRLREEEGRKSGGKEKEEEDEVRGECVCMYECLECTTQPCVYILMQQ